MKLIFKIFLFLALFGGLKSSYSQYNNIKLDVVGLVASNIRVGYERSFSKHFSVVCSFEKGEYIEGSGVTSTHREEYLISGWGIVGEGRYYPFTKKYDAPIGLFVGAHYRYRTITEDFTLADKFSSVSNTISNDAIVNDFGLNLGHKFLFGENISFELLTGYGTASGKWKSETDRDQIDKFYKMKFSDFENRFRFEITFGVVFPKIAKNN